MESIFKAYDVRGVYGDVLTEEAAYRIGRALVSHLRASAVAVGRDMRLSSPALCAALTRGITESGADVVDLGLVTTPMAYFASATLPVDGAVMITASHNPGKYNGMKFCRAGAVPIGINTGLRGIMELTRAELPAPAAVPGAMRQHAVAEAFHAATRRAHGGGAFSVVIDAGNAMGALDVPLWQSLPGVETHALFTELDGSFPNHEANPLHAETLATLSATVVARGAHIGIAYDGDGDRVGFVDEQGAPVPGDLVAAIIARELLAQHPGAAVVYDLRCSRAVPETIEACGGRAIESAVGHSNIKTLMRDHGAIFGGEISQHYYFRDFSFAENSTYAALLLLEAIRTHGKPLSQLVAEAQRYAHSGELNFTVADTARVLGALRDAYGDGEIRELDGLKITYPDWWFSVRLSNTEPLVRLNVEARDPELLAQRCAAVAAQIERCV